MWCWSLIYSTFDLSAGRPCSLQPPVVLTSTTWEWQGVSKCALCQAASTVAPYIFSRLIQSIILLRGRIKDFTLWVMYFFNTWIWRWRFNLVIRTILRVGETNWGGVREKQFTSAWHTAVWKTTLSPVWLSWRMDKEGSQNIQVLSVSTVNIHSSSE